MKKIFIVILMCLPMIVMAQNSWEKPVEKNNTDSKYLAGAVPVVDGKVVFETNISAPGKKAGEIYQTMLRELEAMTKEEGQFEQSRIISANPEKNEICAVYQEWLVFKSTALILDRTRLFYNLVVTCEDGKANVKMTRIHYLYEEERNPQTFKAEEWITDEYGLKKSKEKLSRVTGKFRRKTIDRKDYLFDKFTNLLK